MSETRDGTLSEDELNAVAGGVTASPETSGVDSLSELTQAEQLALQQRMDQLAAAQQLQATVMKKATDTTSSIIANMK
jgi:hypothetical protein